MSDRSSPPEFGRASVPRVHRILLPGVKLDLAVLLLFLLCLWFAVSIAPLPVQLEPVVLFGGSLTGALWFVWRTRRALARIESGVADGKNKE